MYTDRQHSLLYRQGMIADAVQLRRSPLPRPTIYPDRLTEAGEPTWPNPGGGGQNSWREPTQTQEEHAVSTQKGPWPGGGIKLGIRTSPSFCETTVLMNSPPCCTHIYKKKNSYRHIFKELFWGHDPAFTVYFVIF